MKNWLEKSKIIVIFAISFYIAVFAPLEMYISNVSEFMFGINDVALIVLVTMLILCALFICVDLISIHLGKEELYWALLTVILIGTYIQGEYINMDVGVLNGGEVEWKKYLTPMFFDLVFWILLCISVFLMAYKMKEFKKVTTYAAGVLIGIEVITIGVLIFQNAGKLNESNHITTFTTDGLYMGSSEDNVVVFVLDMFDGDYMKQIITENPDYSDRLDGFTLYDNYAGVYSTTVYSLALMSTGKMFYNEAPYLQWMEDVSNQRLYVDELLDSHYGLYYYWPLSDTIPSRLSKKANNYYDGNCSVVSYVGLEKALYQLVVCKILPDGFKPLIWPQGSEFERLIGCDDAQMYLGDNASFRDGVRSNEFAISNEKMIRFIYLNGSHYPYTVDSLGNDFKFGTVTGRECAEGVLNIVLEYLDKLKATDTYDSTAVYITADHGYYWDGTLQAPVCLVKPINSKGTLLVNSTPVSQVNFASTIIDISNISPNDNYGDSLFDVDISNKNKRLFYQYNLSEDRVNGNYRLIEYEIEPNGINRENYKLTGNEYTIMGEKINHFNDCRTCEKGGNLEYDRDYPREMHIRK